jgi:hypothetical protein
MTPRPSARACAITVLSCALCTGCLLRYELDERVRDRTQKDLDARVTSIEVASIGVADTDLRLSVVEAVDQRVRHHTYVAHDVRMDVTRGLSGDPRRLLDSPILAALKSPLVAIDLTTFLVSSAWVAPKAFAESFDPWRPRTRYSEETRTRPARRVRYRVEPGVRGVPATKERTSRSGVLELDLAEHVPGMLSRGIDSLPLTLVDRRSGQQASAAVPLDTLVQLANAHFADRKRDPVRAWSEILAAVPRAGVDVRVAARRELARHGAPARRAHAGVPLPGVSAAGNAPPVVALLSLSEVAPSHTGESQIPVDAVIKDDTAVAEWTLLVNGERIAGDVPGRRGVRRKEHPTLPFLPRAVSIHETIALRPGRNEIVIEARDEDGAIGTAQAVIARAARTPRVVALVIGIDRYSDPALTPLRYAEADALAMADFLRSDRSPVLDPDDVRVLLGEEASARSIRIAIDEHLLRNATHPEDMVILYFAGHGFSMGEKTLLAGADTEHESLRATGVRASELREYFDDVRAGRKVLIADACHTSGLPGTRGGNEVNRGLAGRVAGGGAVSFLASSGTQLSVESRELGHGVFTWALLRGLRGAADDHGDRDGRVSAKELATYLDGEVPTLARRQGHAQQPLFNGTTGGTLFLTR